MNKIVIQVRGYDPYDHNVFDQSTRNVKEENLVNHIAEIVQNVKGCVSNPDYSFYRLFVLDLETVIMELVYSHTNPLWERIEVNLAAKKRVTVIPKRGLWGTSNPTTASMEDMFNEDNDDDHEFEENMVAAMPVSNSFIGIIESFAPPPLVSQ